VGVIGDAVPWMLHSHTAYLGAFAQNATSILAMQRRENGHGFWGSDLISAQPELGRRE